MSVSFLPKPGRYEFFCLRCDQPFASQMIRSLCPPCSMAEREQISSFVHHANALIDRRHGKRMCCACHGCTTHPQHTCNPRPVFLAW